MQLESPRRKSSSRLRILLWPANRVEWYSEPSDCIIVEQVAVIAREGPRPTTTNEPDFGLARMDLPGSQLRTERKTRRILSAASGLTPSNCQANESLVHGVAPRELIQVLRLAKAGNAVTG